MLLRLLVLSFKGFVVNVLERLLVGFDWLILLIMVILSLFLAAYIAFSTFYLVFN